MSKMRPSEIVRVGGEVAELVLGHTSTFVEAVNILYVARAAIAGGIDAVQVDQEAVESRSELP
jgi:hypothetical protein